jgi:hypothetical protein
VRRKIAAGLLGFFVFGTTAAFAEEISLKDGTKLIGHMTAIDGDKIEVETAYGKIMVKRSDILTIVFTENGGLPPTPAVTGGVIGAVRPRTDSVISSPVALPLPKIDETLDGSSYTNRTGNFTLKLPPDWKSAAAQRRYGSTVAYLSSADNTQFVLVAQEQYPGTLDSYKDYVMLYTRRGFDGMEELGHTAATIDGKSVMLLNYRGMSKESKMPLQFITALIPAGDNYVKVSAWCVEPLFHDMQPKFEKILNSYHSTAGSTGTRGMKP